MLTEGDVRVSEDTTHNHYRKELSPQVREQIESLAVVAVTNIVQVTTAAIAQIIASAEQKISESIADAEVSGDGDPFVGDERIPQ